MLRGVVRRGVTSVVFSRGARPWCAPQRLSQPRCYALAWGTSCRRIHGDATAEGSTGVDPTGVKDEGTTPPQIRRLVLHNLPKNWMHEDIIEFVDQVAAHAEIAEPEHANPGIDDEDDDSAIAKVTSPFVHHLRLSFGRRTGLVFGSPRIDVVGKDIADYLLTQLHFEPDDYRNRIYFTEEGPETQKSSAESSTTKAPVWASAPTRRSSCSYEEIVESIEQEQQEALRGLELDRYLLAPDLLLDIAKMNQRRLVTSNENVILDSFVDDDEEAHQSKPRERRAGALQDRVGRGSMHNMPVPKPYIQGRRL